MSIQSPQAVFIRIRLNMESNFTIQALQAGRVSMEVMFHHADDVKGMDASSASHVVGSLQPVSDNNLDYPVTLYRKQRMADFVFNSAAAAIAIIISFGIGCATKVDLVKHQLKFPVSLLVGFCCQIIIMPMVSVLVRHLLAGINIYLCFCKLIYTHICLACMHRTR